VCINSTALKEFVFAIPTDNLWKLLTYKKTGLIQVDNDVINRVVQNGLFRRRNELEADPSFKQIIPYALISNLNSFFVFKRTSGQAEKRLHNKFSLGIGGHMNPSNSTEPNEQYLINELLREVFEEVKLLNGCSVEDIKFIGFLNDDSIPVGRVHIGLLYNIHVTNKNIVVNETDKMTACWIDKSGLAEFYKEMETWSKFTYDNYIK
jgi:predicted NUDIX family phosphoesterase